MGKSNKKTKSDRINALRKQYDAFLEEDKKRKERNEYILGRLDKMRSSTALVPVRHKISLFDTRPAVVNYARQKPECPSVRDFHGSITNQHQQFLEPQTKKDDIYLFEEISKKYILIPKVRSSFTNNYEYTPCVTINKNTERLQDLQSAHDTIPIKDYNPSVNENSDWKSKYEILNILKKEEKGKIEAKRYTDSSKPNLNKESHAEKNQEHVAINYDHVDNINTGDYVESAKELLNDIPEKDVPVDTSHREAKKYEFSQNNSVSFNKKITDNEMLNTNNELISTESSKYEPQDEYNEKTDFSEKQSNDAQNYNVDENKYKIQANSNRTNYKNASKTEYKSTDSADCPSEVRSQVMNNNSLVKERNKSSPAFEADDELCENEQNADLQEFLPHESVQMKVNPEGQADIQKKRNINPMEQTEHSFEHTSEDLTNLLENTKDIDTEQKEIFYSEPNDGNQKSDQNFVNIQGADNYVNQQLNENYVSDQVDGDYVNEQVNENYVAQQVDESYVNQQVDENYVNEQVDGNYIAQQDENYINEQVDENYVAQQVDESYVNQQVDENYDNEQVDGNYVAQQVDESYVNHQVDGNYVNEQADGNYTAQQVDENYVNHQVDGNYVNEQADGNYTAQQVDESYVNHQVDGNYVNEQVDENYVNQQVDEKYENQQVDANTLNAEYSQNEYQQNQEYAYYQTNQPYPIVNDEEMTQRYDPSYEEQYVDSDQRTQQEQYNQNYQDPEEKNHPEQQMMQFEQESENPSQIEKALDVEDGYTVQQTDSAEVQDLGEAYGIQKSDTEELPVSEQMMG